MSNTEYYPGYYNETHDTAAQIRPEPSGQYNAMHDLNMAARRRQSDVNVNPSAFTLAPPTITRRQPGGKRRRNSRRKRGGRKSRKHRR